MCLEIKPGSCLNRAKEDVICYKVVRLEVNETISTPYQTALISNEVINGEKPFIAQNNRGKELTEEAFEIQYQDYCWSRVYGNAIHTFATKNGAKTEATELRAFLPGHKYRVYKCIIPKDTLYYEGDFEGKKSFASQKIVFKEAV